MSLGTPNAMEMAERIGVGKYRSAACSLMMMTGRDRRHLFFREVSSRARAWTEAPRGVAGADSPHGVAIEHTLVGAAHDSEP